MEFEDKIRTVACALVGAAGLASLACAVVELKTTLGDHSRIQQLEDTAKWMMQGDLDLQKETDQQ